MFGRNPEKLEAKALDYERRGKTAKALKYREKAARLRSNQVGAAPLGVTTPLATTGLQQRPPVATVSGVDRNRDGIPDQLQQGGLNQGGFQQGGLGGLQQPGFQQGGFQQQGFQQPGFQQQQGFSSLRTPQRYEQNALKWEQRGNWSKAQKNREKVWRLNNPQHAQYAAPMFYNQQNQFLGYNVPFNPATAQPFQGGMMRGAGLHQVLPPTVETHVHATIVEQTMRPEKIVEVQPVIHRQVDAPQVRVIEKHLYETVPSTGPGVITNAPIVEEVVRPRIIEEIQPVVHRNVPAPFIEHVEQHVTEHITQPTTMTKQVINDATVRPVGVAGMAAGGPPTATVSGVDRNRDGIPDQLQQGGLNQGGLNQGRRL